MTQRQLPAYLIILAFLVALSGCVQSAEKSGTNDAITTESGGNPQNSDTILSDTADASEEPELTTFQIEACNAAEDAGTCDTNLKELGIVSKDECCRILSRCCATQ